MNISFGAQIPGPYTEDLLKKQWPGVTNIKGIERCQIVEIDGEKALQVTFVKGKLGTTDGGASWRYRFEKSFDEFTVEYKVMMAKDFRYVRGGKLPGLCGGSNPRGGTANISAVNGFSARIMWRELGALEQYIYYANQDPKKKHGTDLYWKQKDGMPACIIPGQWYTFKTYIKMNTVSKADGKMISWLNGEEVLNVDLALRNDPALGIDSFQFVTYFGGNDETWYPEKDEKIYFKDFHSIGTTNQ
ncbi:MAG: polysaccharide lyase [Candidatus Paceibacterota bacterium]